MTNFAMHYNDKCNLEVDNMRMFDNTMGMVLHVSGPDITEHKHAEKFVKIKNSLFVGQSPWTDCDTEKVEMLSEDMNDVGKTIILWYLLIIVLLNII